MNTRNQLTSVEIEIDRDLTIERENLRARADRLAQVEAKNPLAKLPKVLRWLGGGLLVAAGATFMFQGLMALTSFQKYLCFLGFTALLGALGVLCMVRFKDDKGARAFFGLAAASLPVHFSQLGALVYSLCPHGELALPRFFIYTAPSAIAVMLTSLLAFIILAPVAYAGFSALARAHAKILTVTYVASNLLLLIPTRTSEYVAIIGLFQLIGTIIVDMERFKDDGYMRTFDGIVCRVLTLVPFFVLIGRSFLYPNDYVLQALIAAAVGIIMFIVIPAYTTDDDWAISSQGFSVIPIASFWQILVYGNREIITNSHHPLLLLALPIAAMYLVMSFAARSSGKNYRLLAAIVSGWFCLADLFIVGGIFSSFICITVSSILVSIGYIQGERFSFFTGLFCAFFGVIYHLKFAIDLYTLSPWLSLAVIGVAALIGSSYIESNRHALIAKLGSFKSKLDQWQ